MYLFTVLPTLVAQTCSPLYRRFVTCGSSENSRDLGVTGTLPITNRGYGRLKICYGKQIPSQHDVLTGNGRKMSSQPPAVPASIFLTSCGSQPWRTGHFRCSPIGGKFFANRSSRFEQSCTRR